MSENGKIRVQTERKDTSLESIDWTKLRSVFIRKLHWLIVIVLLANAAGYLYIRYTKPLYESSSELKLEIKSEATSLGLARFPENYNINNISGEIELINSRLFFNRVIENVDIDVQYFTYGQILDDEKYKHSPFLVNYDLSDGTLYGKTFDVELIDQDRFRLEFNLGGRQISEEYIYGDTITGPGFSFRFDITPYFSEELTNERFYFKINTHESLVNYLEDNISVEPLNLNANTIRISFKDHNKFKAHDLVNAIDTLYLTYTNQEKNLANENKITYLNQQLTETEAILQEFESYFESFTLDNKTVDLDADMRKTLSTINSLDSQRFEIRTRLVHVDEINEIVINASLENLAVKRSFLPDEITKQLEILDELYFQHKQLALTYKENTFAYERKSQELDLARGELIAELNQHRLNLFERLNEVNKRKQDLERRLTDLPSKGTELNKARRYYAIYEEMYLSLMKSKNEFEIARAGTIPDFKILASASLPEMPISPNRMIVYGVGGVSGVLFSFLFLAISYLASNKITSMQELENLINVPILGSLPYHSSSKRENGIAVVNEPRSAPSEAFRSIRTNIEFMLPGVKKRVISITSTISGEGKTFVTLNLATVIAMSGKKVVILDLDLRKPRINTHFGKSGSAKKGISTYLIGKHDVEECIEESGIENLQYIPSGPLPPNPSELLLTSRFKELIDDLRERFDVVLLDTPPLGLVTDAIMVMRHADLRLYIIRIDYSLRSFARSIERLVNVNKFEHIAIVANALKSGSGAYGYGYGYGYGGEYYTEKPNGSLLSNIRKKLRV